MKQKQWGVYVHIPFCRQKCFYCDFPSFAGQERYMDAYIRALCREIEVRGSSYRQQWGEPATVYIGGGTPSVLPASLMKMLLEKLSAILTGENTRELTVECNPGTVDADFLHMLREKGVNRLSFGVQSFDDAVLRRIGRIHTGQDAVQAFAAAHAAGFENLSLDLMYGLPGQTMEILQASVEQALALSPAHVSLYGLQVEQGTVFSRMQEMGRLCLPEDEIAEDMYDYMTETLPAAGYARYEISNFALPGYESRHNLSYWQDVPYLGLGAGAHSYLDGQRWTAGDGITSYIKTVEQGGRIVEPEEPATAAIAMEEFAFLALRTTAGISRERFAQRFGCSLDSVYRQAIEKLRHKGLLEDTGRTVHLTSLGMKYGNWAFEEFLL